MRGILLVALGAALIFLGVWHGDSSSGPGSVDAAERTLPYDGAPSTLEQQTPEGATARAQGVVEGLGPARPVEDDSSALGPAVTPRAEPVPDPQPGGAPAAPPAPPRNDLELVSLDRGGPQGPAAADEPRNVPPEELARLLVQCWTLETPGPLEEYIKTGAGAQLSAGRRQLVASFWRACMGDADGAAAQLDRLAGEAGVTSEQLELLRLALGRAGARALPASASARDPLSRAMRMVLATEEGRVALERNDHARAANAYSDAILLELGAPWAPQRDALLAWGASLDRAQRMHRLSPSGQWPSVDYVVKPDDYLIGIRKRVIAADSRLLLCVGLMEAVNGIKDGRITPGVTLRFPIDQANVLVDLDARVAVFRLGSEVVKLWPVGIGREGHDTPVGSYVVGEKLENPSHMPQGGAALPYGHPDNPLGTRWIAWNKDGRSTSIGFHGTSKPDGVGERVSLGCIRMRNEDVEELFELLPRDARIVVQP